MARYARLPLSGCAIGHAYGVRVLKFDGAFGPEGCGGGFAIGHTFGVRVQKVQKVQRVQRVADCRSAAMLIKSALRDDLAVSYGIISILRIGSLRSPPPIRLRHWTRLRREGS